MWLVEAGALWCDPAMSARRQGRTGAPTQLPRRPQGCVTHIYKYTQTIIYNYLYSGPAPGGGAARPRGRAHSAQWQCVCHSPTVRARAPKLIYGRGRGGLH